MERWTRFAGLGRKEIIFAILAVGMLFTLFVNSESRSSLASAETQFVETSKSGLQIVPASCESNPPYEHFSGECTDVPPPIPGRGCALSITPSLVAPGQSATLGWTIGSDAFSVIESRTLSPSAGGISANAGTLQISPSQATTYTLSVVYMTQIAGFTTGVRSTVTCSANVGVTDGSHCPSGTTWNGTQCVDDDDDGGTGGTCPAGQFLSTTNTCLCVATSLPPVNGSCTGGATCPIGYTRNAQTGLCEYTGCPIGYHLVAGQCIPDNDTEPLCTLPPICSDSTTIRNQCTGVTTNCVAAYGQGWRCVAGACIAPPAPSVVLTVQPSLVRKGETTKVFWQSTDASSCTIVGTNGDEWSGLFSSSASCVKADSGTTCVSDPINAQATFTIRCNGLDGTVASRSVVVNIIPVFIETCNPGFHFVDGKCVAL